MGDLSRIEAELGGFVTELRRADLPIGVGQTLTFTAAVTRVGIGLLDLYWSGRATLITAPEAIGTYNRVFADHFLLRTGIASEGGRQAEATVGSPTSMVTPGLDSGDGDDSVQQGAAASEVEVLRQKWFAACTDEELAALRRLMEEFTLSVPPRPVRRTRSATRGRHLDVRSTVRRAMRTHGEPVEWTWRRPRIVERRLVLLLDVSGSMADYSRALLGFGYAAIRSGISAEAFSFGTRVTRLTPHLRSGGPDEALAVVAHRVPDWDGGTMIGTSLRDLRERWGASLIRSSIVVIVSDGLERGDPEPLRREMARLGRLAHRVVWVNPLKGEEGYAPTARGMASALPHVDEFVAGHNLASLEELAALLLTLR